MMEVVNEGSGAESFIHLVIVEYTIALIAKQALSATTRISDDNSQLRRMSDSGVECSEESCNKSTSWELETGALCNTVGFSLI